MKNLIKLFAFTIIFGGYVFPQWSGDPSINTQVSGTTFSGYNSAIADGYGGTIIVWAGYDVNPNGLGIFAQRLNSDGNRMWGDGIVVCDELYSQVDPKLVSDGMGGAIIIWEDERSGSYRHIYAQRIDLNGTLLWESSGVPVCVGDYSLYNSQIASDNNNGAFIVWSQFNNGLNDIYAQRLDSSGYLVNSQASGIPICISSYVKTSPKITLADDQGNAIICWGNASTTAGVAGIYAQKLIMDGNTQWTENGVLISNPFVPWSVVENSIIADGSGGAIITWVSYPTSGNGQGIFAQRIDQNGGLLLSFDGSYPESGILICDDIGNQYNPLLTSDGNGGAIIAWADERYGVDYSSIYAQKLDVNGSLSWTSGGKPIITTDYSGYDSFEIISTSTGGAIISWADKRNSSIDIYIQKIDSNGDNLWDINGNVVCNNSSNQQRPTLVTDGFDGAILSWGDGRDFTIYAQRLRSDGTLFSNRVDGIISPEEYGSHIESENQFTSDGRTWYMNWDNNLLYIGITGYDDFNDPIILYLDADQVQIPVNDANPQYGNLVGAGDDGILPQLPFSADFYYYLEPGANSGNGNAFTKAADGSGNWVVGTNPLDFVYNTITNTLEFSLPWSDINSNFQVDGGEFNWLGYIADFTFNDSYSRVPANNSGGINMIAPWYYTVRFTGGLGTPAFPFASESYTHVGSSLTIDQLECFDFTMNTSGQTITRTNGNWNINGRMVINDGALSFLNNGDIKIRENYVQLGGEVNCNDANVFVGLNCLYYGGNINLNQGQTFTLDGFSGGILEGPFPFSNLTINKSQFLGPRNVNAWSDQTVNGTLTLQQGNLIMVGPPPTYTQYTLTIGPNGGIGGGGYIQGGLTVFLPPSTSPKALGKVDGTNNLLVNFPVGTANGPSPVSVDFGSVTAGGTLTVQAVESVHPNSVVPNESMKRYWKITKDNDLAFTNANLTFNYLASDFNTMFTELDNESSMVVGKYSEGSWTFPTVASRSILGDGGSITISGVTSFSDFTMAKSESALPVELTSFTASVRNNSVLLNWTTATELNNYGFEVDRSTLSAESQAWEKIGFIAGSGNSNSPKEYSFTDGNLIGGSKFKYRLKQIDNDGTFSYSDEINVEVVPTKFELSQNYPNPFNPSTKIRYSIPDVGSGLAQTVLKVYDILGNEVATLVNEGKPAGVYEVTFDASELSSGIYFYKLSAGAFTETKKMTLLK